MTNSEVCSEVTKLIQERMERSLELLNIKMFESIIEDIDFGDVFVYVKKKQDYDYWNTAPEDKRPDLKSFDIFKTTGEKWLAMF